MVQCFEIKSRHSEISRKYGTLILVQLGQQKYSYLYSYSLIALTITHTITGHTRTSKSTDYCPNCSQKYVINYTNIMLFLRIGEKGPLCTVPDLSAIFSKLVSHVT